MIDTIELESVPRAIYRGNAIKKDLLYSLAMLFNAVEISKQRKLIEDRAEQKFIDDCKYFDRVFNLHTT